MSAENSLERLLLAIEHYDVDLLERVVVALVVRMQTTGRGW